MEDLTKKGQFSFSWREGKGWTGTPDLYTSLLVLPYERWKDSFSRGDTLLTSTGPIKLFSYLMLTLTKTYILKIYTCLVSVRGGRLGKWWTGHHGWMIGKTDPRVNCFCQSHCITSSTLNSDQIISFCCQIAKKLLLSRCQAVAELLPSCRCHWAITKFTWTLLT